MADSQDDKRSPEDAHPNVKLKTLRCRRTGQMFTVAKHVECPYCSGGEAGIRKGGDYDDFCEFDKDKDPINFGFKHDSTRNENG